jgi:hypothetical protein
MIMWEQNRMSRKTEANSKVLKRTGTILWDKYNNRDEVGRATTFTVVIIYKLKTNITDETLYLTMTHN